MVQKLSIVARCPACQLQLCKSRSQLPHAALTEVRTGQDRPNGERQFSCKTCGTTLVNSDDMTIAGWRSVTASTGVPLLL
jgi:hypothetical protein